MAALLIISSALPGCMTAMITSGGRSYSFAEKKNPTAEDVHKELGAPVWSKSYQRPVRIRDTAEFRNWKKHKGSAWDLAKPGETRKPEAANLKVTKCEVFRTIGRPADDDSSQVAAYGMGVGMTFFLGELADPFLVPAAVKWRMDHASDVVWLTMWFDESGRLAAWLRGNAHDPDAQAPRSSTRRPFIE